MFEAAAAQAIGIGQAAAASLAVTGGEFNALPWIIGAVALVVLGGAAMLFMRRRRRGGDAVTAGANSDDVTLDGPHTK